MGGSLLGHSLVVLVPLRSFLFLQERSISCLTNYSWIVGGSRLKKFDYVKNMLRHYIR